MATKNPPRTSRRQFVQAATTATVVSAGMALPTSAVETKAASRELATEVLVCGAGCAGIAAALSAARNGVKVLLVEKAPFAGGIVTSVGLPYFDGIAGIRDKRIVVRGIALELLAKSGVCEPDAKKVSQHNPTIPNTFEFKLLLDDLIRRQSETLRVLFNTFVCDVETKGDRIESVSVANKDGLVRIRPRVVVDCTGDADVAGWAGAPYEQNAEVQPLTLHFRIGNVQRNSEMSKNCRTAVQAAQQLGELPYFYGPGVSFMFAKDEVYVHGVRVPANPTDAADLTRAEMQGRSDAHAMFRAWKKSVPGFENSYFIEAYPWIGVRESRRIIGEYVLTEDDLMNARRFEDAIATGCWYLDLHPNKTTTGTANEIKPEKVQPDPYDIPYRALLPQKIGNLLVAGRCHSATRGAHASTRVTATAMAMGEAAGVAAALAAKGKTSAREIAGTRVREQLEKQNAGPFTDA